MIQTENNRRILISAIIIVLVALVSFNFEKITGKQIAGAPINYEGTRTIEFFKNGEKVDSINAGSTGSIKVVVKPTNPNINSMKLGYSLTSEKLFITGLGVRNQRPTNYKCDSGKTSDCKKASVTVSPETDWKGNYKFVIKKDQEELGSSILRVI